MIDSYILALVDYALNKKLIEQDDYIYAVNGIMRLCSWTALILMYSL